MKLFLLLFPCGLQEPLVSDSSLYPRAGELTYGGECHSEMHYVIWLKLNFSSGYCVFLGTFNALGSLSWEDRVPHYVTELNGFFECFGQIVSVGTGRFPLLSMHDDCKRGSYFPLTQIHDKNLRPSSQCLRGKNYRSIILPQLTCFRWEIYDKFNNWFHGWESSWWRLIPDPQLHIRVELDLGTKLLIPRKTLFNRNLLFQQA